MTRLSPLIFMLVAWPALAGGPNPPNILILMAEDMSPRVGAFDDPVAVTPHLDSLAAEGVRYTRTFTTAGVCSPSRAAHILGMHQISTGTQHMRSSGRPEGSYFSVPPAHVKAYPELLRAAGYYTFTDEKLDYQFSGIKAGSGPFTIWDKDNTTEWRGRNPGQPFYGLVNFQATHETGVFTPLGSMPNSLIHFASQVMRWWRLGDIPYGIVSPKSIQLEPYYADTPTVRKDIARHYDNIAYMDAEVSGILQKLEEDGLSDSTIVIWTTDHGDGLPRAKRELFDSGIRVPMIIRWPEAYRPEGLHPGQLDERLISFVDLAPTILTLAGITPPDYMHGRDFSAPDKPARDYIFASRDRIDEVADRQRAVRDKRFKYIRSWHPELPGGHPLKFRDNIKMMREMRAMYDAGELSETQRQWFTAPGQERLFDLANDPYELVDISTDPRFSDDLVRMQEALDSWLASIVDWSDMSETEMVSVFYPKDLRPQTPAPRTYIRNGRLEIERATGSESYGYRIADGPWLLYREDRDIEVTSSAEVRAIRYGWETSEIITVRPGQSTDR